MPRDRAVYSRILSNLDDLEGLLRTIILNHGSLHHNIRIIAWRLQLIIFMLNNVGYEVSTPLAQTTAVYYPSTAGSTYSGSTYLVNGGQRYTFSYDDTTCSTTMKVFYPKIF